MRKTLALLLLPALLDASAKPSWIWSSKNPGEQDRITVRKEFEVKGEVKKALLWMTCDNGATATLNKRNALRNPDWQEPSQAPVLDLLRQGANELLIDATNKGGIAGLLVRVHIEYADGRKVDIESDATWQAAAAGATDFKPAVVIAPHGAQPWGDVMGVKPSRGGEATPAEEITVKPGFAVELLYTVPKPEQGSWVAMTPAPKGRLIVCDQYGSLYRVTPAGLGGAKETTVTALKAPVGGAHGLLWAFDSLYVMVNEQKESGIHRLWDADDDGAFERHEKLTDVDGRGEHGPHSFALSPDGKKIFFCIGNHTQLPAKLSRQRMADAWGEDHVLSRLWDGNGHARGVLAPGGTLHRMDPDGSNIELWSGGYRNQFDFAVDPNGDIFTFDADMEWDLGMPWYRPTRYIHCTAGTDSGWRSGSGKWPGYYPDNIPHLIDIGPGSPTGVAAGTGAKFPARYQRAIFGNDWTYGTMYAVHLTPAGASFTAEKEEFLFAKPLPLTDVVIHPADGAMYFMVGGRRTQSALYRVTYTGKESTAPAAPLPLTAEAKLRRELEALQEPGAGPEAVAKAWPHLGHADRFIRAAARVAIERQPVAGWKDRALAEANPIARIEALIALARVGRSPEAAAAASQSVRKAGASSGPVFTGLPQDAALQQAILRALDAVDAARLDTDARLALYRAYQLAFTRLGKFPADTTRASQARLEALFPAKDAAENRELCQLLVFLESPSVVARTLNLMAAARDDSEVIATDALLERNTGYGRAAATVHESRPNRQQIAYLAALRNATAGWTPELRRSYFGWFPMTRAWRGGNSFKNFMENIRKEALETFVPAAEREELDKISTRELLANAVKVTPPKGPGHSYTVDDVVRIAEGKLVNRDYASGKNLYHATLCATCHLFAGEGGNVGPDLTGSGNRYTLRDLAENIIEPSKVISDIYDNHLLLKKDGSMVIGRIVAEENGQYLVMTNPFAPDQLAPVPAAEVKEKKPLGQSIMPPSLINTLNEGELLDLLAYLRSGGNAKDPMFKQP